MAKEAVTFRMDPDKRQRLDEVAALLGQDRTQAIDLAIDAYLDFHEWQIEHIKAGLAEALEGKFASDEEMDELWRRFERKP